MREPAANAIIELVSSLDTGVVEDVTNNVIVPKLLAAPKGKMQEWMCTLTPEQIAVALHLQMPQNKSSKYSYPLDKPLLTTQSLPTLASALSSTSTAVHPRCHIVWNAMWLYLTEDIETHRQLRSDESSQIIDALIQHVVVDVLLGKGEGGSSPTNERKSLALQIVSTLAGSSGLQIVLPSSVISSVLCPEVVEGVFMNVLCASGGIGKKKGGDNDGSSVDHHLKPLTASKLSNFVENCSEVDFVERRMAFAQAFLSVDPRFDVKTKTQTVTTLLMMENRSADLSEEHEGHRAAIWGRYLSLLEEQVVSAKNLHVATVYIELMFKLAKRDLSVAPAYLTRRVVRFFMSAAFFDCSGLMDLAKVAASSKKKKKGKKTSAHESPSVEASLELSSGLRIKELLNSHELQGIPYSHRAIMSARFFSLLSDLVSAINAQNRGGSKGKSFYGKVSRPEAVYRALSEVSGICSLLETSGAKLFQIHTDANGNDDSSSEAEEPMLASRKHMLQVKKIADDALVEECGGSGDSELLRAKAVFATGCGALMMSMYLQLNSCGVPDTIDEDDTDDDTDAVHEYIADLADSVANFCAAVNTPSRSKGEEERENPLAAVAGLLVNILSSSVGGEDTGGKNAIQSSASKLTRETVKLAWSGSISMINGLHAKEVEYGNFVDEDVMNILIEAVCGANSTKEATDGDYESAEESESSEDELEDGGGVFADASKSGMDLDEVGNATDEDDESDKKKTATENDEDVELDPSALENLLLEDSDAEMSENGFGQLEHHAGADAALAQLIKLKQEARKASQSERERIEFCNRLRCITLLESLFSASVFKSGWIPVEAVLGSIVPILQSRKAITKSIQAASSTSAKKSLNEKNAMVDRLSVLIKDKISKFRCNDDDEAGKVALKAASDISEELNRSLNLEQSSCCSVALITAVRCIPNAEGCEEVKQIYVNAANDWRSRKGTKIHACVFEDLIHRMPR